jgi:hypothetical protein
MYAMDILLILRMVPGRTLFNKVHNQTPDFKDSARSSKFSPRTARSQLDWKGHHNQGDTDTQAKDERSWENIAGKLFHDARRDLIAPPQSRVSVRVSAVCLRCAVQGPLTPTLPSPAPSCQHEST